MFETVQREPSLTNRVIKQLEQLIMSSRLQPGDRLPAINDLAQEFGVSRTVIREAIRSLSARGLVEVKHGSGTVVSHPSAEDISQAIALYLRAAYSQIDYLKVNQVRSLLELEIAGLAAENRTPADLEVLAANLQAMEVLCDQQNGPVSRHQFAKLDVDFHSALAQATHNELFVLLLNSVIDIMREARLTALELPGVFTRVFTCHTDIFQAVAESDPGQARTAMRIHLSDAESHFNQVMAAYGKREIQAMDDAALSTFVEQGKLTREMLRSDPHRPQFHFQPPSNWMNDPNGLIQWNGKYHLFYQHNPYGPLWGNIHWGHATSDDLVFWEDLPIALAPTPNALDKDGCWSGCAVNDHGTPTVIYTGVKPEVQCLATGSENLVNWEKQADPVIADPPPELDLVGFRDPYVWQEGDEWYMVLGTGIRDVGGAILLYKSPDLRQWDYLGPLLIGDKLQTGEMWECPNFFALGDKYVLLISVIPRAYTLYFIGTYKNHKFIPERQGRLDFGRYFYAPQAFLDDHNRRIMFGWVWDGCTDDALQAAGWAGMQSVPRLLSLGDDTTLRMNPAPELSKLRGTQHQFSNFKVTPASPTLLPDIQGDSFEIVVEFEQSTSGYAGLVVRSSADGKEQTRIVYQWATQFLSIDRQRTSLDPNVDSDSYGGRVELKPGERLKLHVFLDHSVIEAFANERACLTSRIYPSRRESLGVGVFAQGDDAQIHSLDIWEMQSIS